VRADRRCPFRLTHDATPTRRSTGRALRRSAEAELFASAGHVHGHRISACGRVSQMEPNRKWKMEQVLPLAVR
jgi:hypothetical protein